MKNGKSYKRLSGRVLGKLLDTGMEQGLYSDTGMEQELLPMAS